MGAFKWGLIAVCAMCLAACAETENKSSGGTSAQAGSGGTGGEGGQAGAGGAAGAGGSMNQGGAGGQGSMPVQPECYAGLAMCNPLTNAGCTNAGEACDYGTKAGNVGFYCYPPPNEVPEGQPCTAHGPYCAPTFHCFGVCKKFCCADNECAQGESCVPFDAAQGTLGFCRDPNVCSPPGGPCQKAEDCCSMDCHDDHCH